MDRAVSLSRYTPQQPGRRRAGKAGKDRRLHVGVLARATLKQLCDMEGPRSGLFRLRAAWAGGLLTAGPAKPAAG